MECSKCKKDIPEDSEFCPFCGESIGDICKNCGSLLLEDSIFCNKCGEKVKSSNNNLLFCPRCHKKLKEDSTFCKNCGKKLDNINNSGDKNKEDDDLNVKQLLLIQSEYEKNKKSPAAAWLLLIFLGYFGAHRFYMRRIGSAVAFLLITLVCIGVSYFTVGISMAVSALWWFIDLFLLSGIIREENSKIRKKIKDKILNTRI